MHQQRLDLWTPGAHLMQHGVGGILMAHGSQVTKCGPTMNCWRML